MAERRLDLETDAADIGKTAEDLDALFERAMAPLRVTLPKPGIYPGTSWDVYSSWPACRSSYLKHFKRSAAHARIAMLEPETPTRTMDLGSALHCAILEPERFEREYIETPVFGDLRSPANKAKKALFYAENAGKGVLSPDEWQTVECVREAIWNEPWAASLLSGPGANELSAVWRDAELGVDCKLRVDRYGNHEGYPALIDLKSARDAGKDAFRRAVANFDYDLQAALYLDGLETLSPHPRRFLWIAFERTPPYAAALYEPTEELLAEGRRRYKAALAAHAECTRSGYWPGYSSACQLIDLPPWAKQKLGGEAAAAQAQGGDRMEDSDELF